MAKTTIFLSALALLTAALLMVSCASDSKNAAAKPAAPVRTVAKVDPPTMNDEKGRDYAGLHNVVAFHNGYYSGSMPEGEAGFDSLAGMGIKTIISVDGGEPDLALAKARGMRYIHLPIGYNGFDEQRKLELARATRDGMKDGPVYIHCHHGKHRSAGAAGTAVVSLGWATPEEMVKRMKVSGTAAGYKGLYACTTSATALSAATIDAVPANFPEVSRPVGFVKSMVHIDEINEHLKAIEKAGWTVPKDHPDLVPAAEAGRMADLLRLCAEGERAKSKPADFAGMLRSNGEQVAELEQMIVAGEKDTKKLSAQFALVAASCKDCHVKYRD